MPQGCQWRAQQANDPTYIKELEKLDVSAFEGIDWEDDRPDPAGIGVTQQLLMDLNDRIEILIAQNAGEKYKPRFQPRPKSEEAETLKLVKEAILKTKKPAENPLMQFIRFGPSEEVADG